MTRERTRRAFLAGAGASLLGGVAGCSAQPPRDEATPAGGDRTGTTAPASGDDGEADASYVDVYRQTVGSIGLVRVYDEDGPRSQGSGFAFRGDYLATNQHVVDGGSTFRVEFRDGQWTTASLVGSDVYSDLAVLSLEDRPSYATPLSFVRREPPIGTRVIVLGAPFGLSQSASAGIVSGQDRSLPSTTGFRIPDGVQTDAAVNPGNSGGPLVNMAGDVVGVINSGGGENIGFAISAGLCRRVLPALVADGEYDHPFMGVRLLELTPTVARANGLDRARGVLVVEVMDGGPSDGVLRGSPDTETVDGQDVPVGGDVIVAMGGRGVPDEGTLSEILALQGTPGETIAVTVLRDGRRVELDLELGERPRPGSLE